MTEIALIALNFATNAFWAFVYFRLANRFMSRSFPEYVAATRKPIKREPVKQSEEPDEYAEAQARQMNALIGVG